MIKNHKWFWKDVLLPVLFIDCANIYSTWLAAESINCKGKTSSVKAKRHIYFPRRDVSDFSLRLDIENDRESLRNWEVNLDCHITWKDFKGSCTFFPLFFKFEFCEMAINQITLKTNFFLSETSLQLYFSNALQYVNAFQGKCTCPDSRLRCRKEMFFGQLWLLRAFYEKTRLEPIWSPHEERNKLKLWDDEIEGNGRKLSIKNDLEDMIGGITGNKIKRGQRK